MSATQRIQPCLDNLKRWNEAYRNSQPVVSDAVYDAALDDLRQLVEEAEDAGHAFVDSVKEGRAFLSKLDATPATGSSWAKVSRDKPLLSLNKARDWAEFEAWYAKHAAVRGPAADQGFTISEKLDGLTVELTYRGHFVSAVTRGDEDPSTGRQTGEDISTNVRQMHGFRAQILGFTGTLRAEIMLLKPDWQQHLNQYANPRNGAAGCARDQSGAGAKHLTLFYYEVSGVEGARRQYEWLHRRGLRTPWHMSALTLADIKWHYDAVAAAREKLDREIDGLVVQHNDTAIVERLGIRERGHEAFIAIKFPAEKAQTALIDIEWQVGGTGRITPVAVFQPVVLTGARVERATLHNLDQMRTLLGAVQTFHVGDTIECCRAGDVIPQVARLVQPCLSGAALFAPSVCPSCKQPVSRDGSYLVCTNWNCPAQAVGRVLRWLDKIGVKEWGEALVQACFDSGLVHDIPDMYRLTTQDLADVKINGVRVGRKADEPVANLQAQMELPLHVFVGALSIPLMARSMCAKLVEAGYDTLPKMQWATAVELAGIDGVGTARAASFVVELDRRASLIQQLLAAGVRIRPPAQKQRGGALSGKSFCVTGFRDADMEKRIEAHGGTVKSGVGRDLSYLVVADTNSTSSKADKARQHGVQIITRAEAWDLLGGK